MKYIIFSVLLLVYALPNCALSFEPEFGQFIGGHQWSFGSSVSSTLSYDSNRNLSRTARTQTTSLEERVKLSAALSAPRYQWRNILNVYHREDDVSSQTEDQSFSLDSIINLNSEIWTVELGFSFNEINRNTLDDLIDGNEELDRGRDINEMNLDATWMSSETLLTGFRLSAQSNQYENERSASIYDYKYYNVSTYVQKNLSSVSYLTATLFASELDNVSNLNEHVTVGVSLGYGIQPTEKLNVSFDLGYRDTEFSSVFEAFNGSEFVTDVFTVEKGGVVSNLNAGWQGEKDRWKITGSRALIPDGFSETVDRRSIILTYRRQHSSRFSSEFKLEGRRQGGDLDNSASDNIRVGIFRYQWNWDFQYGWQLGTGYRHIYREDLDIENDSVTSSKALRNLAFFTLKWRYEHR